MENFDHELLFCPHCGEGFSVELIKGLMVNCPSCKEQCVVNKAKYCDFWLQPMPEFID